LNFCGILASKSILSRNVLGLTGYVLGAKVKSSFFFFITDICIKEHKMSRMFMKNKMALFAIRFKKWSEGYVQRHGGGNRKGRGNLI
jgi:hypothetical protein